MSFLAEVVDDAETAILSIGAAVAGSASERISAYILHRATVINDKNVVGATGINFAVRALVGAAAFSAVSSFMPETSKNIFFSIVFFASYPSLVRDAVLLGNAATGTALAATTKV